MFSFALLMVIVYLVFFCLALMLDNPEERPLVARSAREKL
jgi:hypothetical protein